MCAVPIREGEGTAEVCLVRGPNGEWGFPVGDLGMQFDTGVAALAWAEELAGLRGTSVGRLTEFRLPGRYGSTVAAELVQVTAVVEPWTGPDRVWFTLDAAVEALQDPILGEVLRAVRAHLTGELRRACGREESQADLADGERAVVLLEDDARRVAAMRALLGEHPLRVFDNAPDLLAWLERNLSGVVLVSLDHDLGPSRDRGGERFDPGSGRDVVDWLTERDPVCPVLVHTSNSRAAPGMEWSLEHAGWTQERVVPHGDLDWIEAAWLPAVRRRLTGSGQP